MAAKVTTGQPIPRSAALWNNIIGAANEYAGRSAARPSAAGGSGAPAAGVVKIKNSTASHVRLGEVLEISGFLLSNVVRSHLWFDGASPDGTRPFVIAMQDMPIGTIDCAIAAGVCVALVNVTDVDHGYASVSNGSSVLQSDETGTVRLLYKPAGSTGELTCAVLFSPSPAPNTYLAKAVGVVSARSGTTPGTGTVGLYRFDGVNMVEVVDANDEAVEITVRNWSSASTASDAWLWVAEDAFGVYWVVSEDCPA